MFTVVILRTKGRVVKTFHRSCHLRPISQFQREMAPSQAQASKPPPSPLGFGLDALNKDRLKLTARWPAFPAECGPSCSPTCSLCGLPPCSPHPTAARSRCQSTAACLFNGQRPLGATAKVPERLAAVTHCRSCIGVWDKYVEPLAHVAMREGPARFKDLLNYDVSLASVDERPLLAFNV